MVSEYLAGIFRIANLLIALFVMLYAWLFLYKTTKRNERKPWDHLFVASFIFVLYQILSLIGFVSELPFGIDPEILRLVLEFMFSGLVLLSFVSQHDLIMRNPLILLSRRKDKDEEE